MAMRCYIACLIWMLLPGALVASAGMTSASGYPTKQVTIIVPFPPGGATDVQARLIAKGLTERLGRPVVVDNQPGASGRIAAGVVRRSEADGHTLLFCSTGTLVVEPILRPDEEHNPQQEFTPVTTVAEMPWVLVVPSASPFRTVADLVSAARQDPGKLTYASVGAGTFNHLVSEAFKASAKADILHIPYKGEGPALIDLLGDRITVMFMTPLAATPNIRTGKLRALAVSGSKRSATLPQVPTLAEEGIPMQDLNLWFGVVVPSKTPPEITALLHREIVAVVESQEFIHAVEAQGAHAAARSGKEFAELIAVYSAAVARMVQEFRFRVQE